jgi:hypothetical protein
MAGFEAAALVDRDVDQHDPRFIVLSMSRVTSFGAAAPGTSTAPITSSASRTASAIAAFEAKAS